MLGRILGILYLFHFFLIQISLFCLIKTFILIKTNGQVFKFKISHQKCINALQAIFQQKTLNNNFILLCLKGKQRLT